MAWIAITLLATPSPGADVYLVAQQFTATMPGSVAVIMWGFASATTGFATVGTPTVPGPRITVPPGDTTLNIHLRNDLPSHAVSIVIPGQLATLSPVRTPPDGQGRTRVTSFTAETAAGGGQHVYSWTNLRPGSYPYHSGTHPAVQVQMGLYGPVTVQAPGVNQAYPGVGYDNEAILFYSEIDPALHDAVAMGTYGTPAYPSTIEYVPKYFLINGAPHPSAAPVVNHPILLGERVLVRFFNQGLRSHIPTLDGSYMTLIAEDGNRYPYPKEQYSTLLPAGKTVDALLTASSQATLPLYDRALALTNDEASPGGMLAFVNVGVNLVDRRVSASSDDAEQATASGSVNIGSGDLDLMTDGTGTGGTNQVAAGIRFTGLNIQRGAPITRAYIQFQVDEVSTGTTSLTIQGQAIGNASTFTSAAASITSRLRTTNQVVWSPQPWPTIGTQGPAQQTADIRRIVQEIVNRPDWNPGNALAVIITGTGRRVAESFEGLPAGAPLLHVEYGVVSAAAATTTTTTTTTTAAPTTTTTAAPTTTTTLPPTAQTRDIPVMAGNDDAEQSASGSVNLGSSDLELIRDSSDQKVGMRFRNVTIPPGAIIDLAYIQFQVDETNSETTNLTITGQNVGNAPAFSTNSNDISSRLRTVSVSWPGVPAWPTLGARGVAQQTTDIAAILRQLVNRGDWASGNAVVIIVEGTGKRVAESYEGLPAGAATLHVEFHTGGGGPTTTTTTTLAPPTTTTAGPTTTTTTTLPPTAQTRDIPVSTGSDDAEESASGSVQNSSSDLELIRDSSDQTVGMRFRNVTIPPGATIDLAYVQFQVDETSSETTTLTITGQDVGNAPAFGTNSNNISSRLRTVSVSWPNVPAWPTVGARGTAQRTTDIKAILQQLVTRGDWGSGNAMVIIIQGTGKRVAESYDGSQSGAPTLHVEFH